MSPKVTPKAQVSEGGFLEEKILSPFRTAFKDLRRATHRILGLLLIVCTALMIWKGLIFYTGSESPIVVVLSGSMEPTFYKGDILTLSIPDDLYQVGDIVVFKIPKREIPIVHRILEIHTDDITGQQMVLTKGDNNDSFDRPLYMGTVWIEPNQILGKARMILPSLGHLTIILTEYPKFKFALLALMGWFVITAKE